MKPLHSSSILVLLASASLVGACTLVSTTQSSNPSDNPSGGGQTLPDGAVELEDGGSLGRGDAEVIVEKDGAVVIVQSDGAVGIVQSDGAVGIVQSDGAVVVVGGGDDGSTGEAGAAPDAGPEPDFQSGTRLRARVTQSADGPVQFDGWHDAQLSMDCWFDTASDGKQRCLPLNATGATFSDASCSQPVLVVNAACTTGLPYVKQESLTCGGGATVYAVESLVTSGTYYVQGGNGTCVQAGAPAAYYSLGAPADPSTFVAETSLVSEPRGPHYAITRATTEDGATAITQWIDTSRNEACGLGYWPGVSRFRCYPYNAATGVSLYSDATCSTTVAFSSTVGAQCATTPPAVAVYTTDSCNNGTLSYATLGAPLTSIYSGSSTSCSPYTIPSGEQYYSIGAPLPDTAFPGLAPDDQGSGRIQTRVIVADTGERLSAYTFYDTMLAQECSALISGDGTLRCIPTGSGAVQLYRYSDPGCTQPVVEIPTGCAPPTLAVLDDTTTDACAYRTRYFNVGAAVTLSTVYYGSPANCQSATEIDDFYATTEIAPSTFAPLTTATE